MHGCLSGVRFIHGWFAFNVCMGEEMVSIVHAELNLGDPGGGQTSKLEESERVRGKGMGEGCGRGAVGWSVDGLARGVTRHGS